MKKSLPIILVTLLLSSCVTPTPTKDNEEALDDFGVFLGLEDNSKMSTLMNYKRVAIELDEFSSNNIQKLRNKHIEVYAYLSVGSLEKYRDYYNEFKDYTFYDYDNWDDERWMDVSQTSWQNKMSELATEFRNKGATGLFLDNFDVYYIACDEYKGSKSFTEGIYNGCHKILENLSRSGLSLLINSGTMFLERLNTEKDSLIDEVDWYAQETVFSSIVDYDNDIFGKQDKEEQDYCFSMIKMMRPHSNVLLIEYTKDNDLVREIKEYANANKVHYYISSRVNLD